MQGVAYPNRAAIVADNRDAIFVENVQSVTVLILRTHCVCTITAYSSTYIRSCNSVSLYRTYRLFSRLLHQTLDLEQFRGWEEAFQSPPIYKELCVCDSFIHLGMHVTAHRGQSF